MPYWAVVWPAAQVLAKYIIQHPNEVIGKQVLDLGCGGAIAGLAALKAGAASVIANDIDPTALFMASLNAQANQMSLRMQNQNLLANPPEAAIDLILVGDMFYDKSVSKITIEWLSLARQQGTRVLIADGSRPFAPKSEVEILASEFVPTNLDLDGRTERLVSLLSFKPN